ncbi:hypothetical protein [Microbacterium sp. JZ101]
MSPVLNDVIANVGLPAIQADLGMSPAAMPWAVNAYILLFGALLYSADDSATSTDAAVCCASGSSSSSPGR